MTHLANVSPLAGVAATLLIVVGALLSFTGSLGLLRLKRFYDRVHAPTMGTTLGTLLVLAASGTLFTSAESRPVVHEILIAIFMTITTPVTFMLLVRAAMHRDYADEGHSAATRDAETENPRPFLAGLSHSRQHKEAEGISLSDAEKSKDRSTRLQRRT